MYLDSLKTIKETINTNNIEIQFFNTPEEHYFINSEVTVDNNNYWISIGFWNIGFDCRVEREEMKDGKIQRVNYIEFGHSKDLEETLNLAIDKIIEYDK